MKLQDEEPAGGRIWKALLKRLQANDFGHAGNETGAARGHCFDVL
jgi:hypothetical protein